MNEYLEVIAKQCEVLKNFAMLAQFSCSEEN